MARPSEALAPEVAFLDRSGVIVQVNAAWTEFTRANGGDPLLTGVGTHYLRATADATDDPLSRLVDSGVQAAVIGALPIPMTVRIPCDSERDARWFDMSIASRFDNRGDLLGATITFSRVDPDDDALAALRDHAQIVGELHQHVVQDLYATGLGLQTLLLLLPGTAHEERVIGYIDALDETVRRIHRIILALDSYTTEHPSRDRGLRHLDSTGSPN